MSVRNILLCVFAAAGLNRAAGQAPTIVTHSLIDSGAMPQVFAPGIISTPFSEWSTSFTPDEKTVFSSQGAVYWTIVSSTLEAGKWTKQIGRAHV